MAAPILSGLSISERDADYLSTAISDTDFDDLTNLLETRAFAPAKAIGNIGCNIARAKTVAALAGASLAMKNLQVMCAGNASASSAVSSASSGLSQSRAAVAQIAAEIVTLQAPSAQARDATLAGLTTAKNSLATISSLVFTSL
ncbi:hypothetical protein H0H93_005452 [Arthromyces matolae]|nr:hypothetical protein H0H93_005452 [Arthromyces matolae]